MYQRIIRGMGISVHVHHGTGDRWEYLDQCSGRDESVSRVPLHIERVGLSVSVQHVRDWEYPYPCILRVLKMSVPMHRGKGGSVCSVHSVRGGKTCTSAS